MKEKFEEKYSQQKTSSTKTIKDFDLIKVIGSGGYADVFLSRDKTNMQYAAIKIIDKGAVVEKNHQKHMILEKRISISLDFPFIASMDAAFMDNVYIYFVLPFINGGDVYNLLQKYERFSFEVTRFYLSQLVLALEYLHFCGVVHRDIKPENVLVEGSGYLKLCDFGFAKRIERSKTWTLCGTPDYLSPELIMSKGYGYSIDWWAIGVMTFEMLVGNTPFFASDPAKLYQKIIDCNYKCPDHLNAESKSLIKGLLAVDPTKRLGCLKGLANDIKHHAFFSEFDWSALMLKKLKAPVVPLKVSPGDTKNFPDLPDVKLRSISKCLYEKEFADF